METRNTYKSNEMKNPLKMSNFHKAVFKNDAPFAIIFNFSRGESNYASSKINMKCILEHFLIMES